MPKELKNKKDEKKKAAMSPKEKKAMKGVIAPLPSNPPWDKADSTYLTKNQCIAEYYVFATRHKACWAFT